MPRISSTNPCQGIDEPGGLMLIEPLAILLKIDDAQRSLIPFRVEVFERMNPAE